MDRARASSDGRTAGGLAPGWRERFVDIGAIRLHLVEAGPADGPPVILLHGFPEYWWGWRKQIGPLAAAGLRVIAPDMRGYNRSDVPPGIEAYHVDVLAGDVVALADALDIDRFHLVGHDWGGVVAWWTARRYPDRVERLTILDAPHPDILARQALRHPTQALRSTYALFFQLPWAPEAVLGRFDFAGLRAMMEMTARQDAFEPGAMDRYVEAWSRPGVLTAMLNYYRALRHRTSADSPARITMPTLILWGERDSALEHHVAEASLALCDRGELRIIEGSTHWLHLEEPQRVVEELIVSRADAG